MDIAQFKTQPLLGILRGIEKEHLAPVLEAVIASGLKTIEIAMNTPDALASIREAKRRTQGKLVLGAGTVLTMDALKSALDAGATFIVLPVLVKEVVAYCVKNKIPVFPGALTPEEIYKAWDAGATMVKVFPAKCFGPEYFLQIKGPLNDIELLACAGVTSENLRDYFSCGASAVAFGGSVFKKEWLRKKEYVCISEAIKEYLEQLT